MKYAEYRQLHYSFFRTLILQLGLRCPLRCKHCSVFAAPSRKEVMPPDLATHVVRDFARLEDASLVVLTGGEPFALGNTLLEALQEIRRHPRLRSYAITSAYWSTSPEEARRVLEALPPLDLLMVSADVYHEEFVPLERVAWAVHACVQLGRDAVLSIAVDQGNDAYADRVLSLIDPESRQRIEVEVLPVQPTGRARAAGIGRFDTTPDALPEGACDILGTPVVTPNGNAVTCCQIDVVREGAQSQDSVYALGNVIHRSIADMRRHVDSDVLLQALRVWGPKELALILHRAGLMPPLRPQYDGPCFLCRDLLASSATVQHLRRLLTSQEVQGDIVLSRFLQYGESRPCPAVAMEHEP